MKKPFALAIWLALLSASAWAASASGDDPVLSAMRAELERSKSQLKLSQMQAPYYIEYSVTDSDVYSAAATFGALSYENRIRARLLTVNVRVGDYKRDNTLMPGAGQVEMVALDGDSFALRRSLWLATDRAYKQALKSYATKQAVLQRFQETQQIDDFSREAQVTAIDRLVVLDLGKQDWPALLKSLSSRYRQDPALNSFEATASFGATNRYFVNSEGTVLRRGSLLYQIEVRGTTQAADGMRLEQNYGEITPNLQEFPTIAKLEKETGKLLETLKQLRQAPLVKETYQGPVLFEPKAADIVVSDLIAQNVIGTRPAPGSNAHTSGKYGENYKSRILPAFVSIVDDPTLKSFKGESLPTAYEYDDEGVKAQTVTVVDKGQLVNYLTSRQPIPDFPRSNGHGRAQFSFFGPSTTASASTMIVQAAHPVSPDELKKKLIEACRQEDLPFGYMVEEMAPSQAPGFEERDEERTSYSPRLLYRIYASDGRQELVRGAELDGLDTHALHSSLTALGDDPLLEGAGSSELPIAVISPSMLFSDLEIRNSNAGKDKLPQYPPPPLSGN